MALVNVNNQAMPMGDDTGRAGDGQTGPKRHFKHIGELADESKAKVVIVYRTEGGQQSAELGEFLGRQTFPDGTNMLAMLHNDNYLKKFSTKDVIVTYGNTTDGRIALNKLNEQIARDMGIKVSELAVKDDSPKAEAQPKKADAKKTTAKK